MTRTNAGQDTDGSADATVPSCPGLLKTSSEVSAASPARGEPQTRHKTGCINGTPYGGGRDCDCLKPAPAAAPPPLAPTRDLHDVAAMSAAYCGAMLARLGTDVLTLVPSELRAACLVRVEERPGGGVRLTRSDTTLGAYLASRPTASPPVGAPAVPVEEAARALVKAMEGVRLPYKGDAWMRLLDLRNALASRKGTPVSTCEKCWADSMRDPYDTVEEYRRLVKERTGKLKCTPEQQAGPDAMPFEKCGGRRVRHQHTGECMVDFTHTLQRDGTHGAARKTR